MAPLSDADPTRIGPYRLHGRLGVGGMGQVFLGRSPGGRMVAVKVVRPELAEDADFRRRFASEAAAARRVGGFYTAQVVDADPEGTPPWLATAYIPGPSLHQAVTAHGPLPLESVAVLGAGLAEGLAAVHASGVVHRDLKPANVILAEDGPRLIDFGIARALDTTSHTRTSTVLGTAAFMSPEQAAGEKVGPESDVFSLGCVLAYAATGRSPFGDGPVHAVVYRVVHTPPDLTGLPAELADLVGACLAKDPGSRPAVRSVLDRLAALSEGTGPGRWLPEELTQVITERRTLVATTVEPGDGGTPPPSSPPSSPRPSSGSVSAGATRPPDLKPTGATLLAHERRRASGGAPPHPADGYRAAVYVLLGLCLLLSLTTVAYQLFVESSAAPRFQWRVDAQLVRYRAQIGHPLSIVQGVVNLGLVIAWLIWFFQVRAVAERFAPGRLRYRPATAVWGWFVPVVNLIVPKQIADDVWHASSHLGADGAMAPARVLHMWWALWLATFLTWPFLFVPWYLYADQREPLGTELLIFDLEPMAWFNFGAQLLLIAAAVAAFLFVRRLTAMQAARLAA
ncbi:serine/threonine protein kinase [Nocardiopsis sp. Huas11]|uniref:protein kinase domain-containing protein n=1 Tax=Nocardiopsis sp. Huas11 TaxID=2183912 RepID=UPI000F1394FC|nr:protein kinase [Nocardiopsis sp. Huas11]RKS07495.1 serine/threonine protein kinase [Nocardiopsis sp. Huas11]